MADAASSVPMQYWSQPMGSLLQAVQSTSEGLSAVDARQRLGKFGPNVLRIRKQATPLRIFVNQFKSPIVLILLFATGVSAALLDWVDALIVLAIVLGSAGLSFVQEYSATSAAEKLRAQLKVAATVLRGGLPQSVPAEEVVPGDVILLSAGDLVPADGVLLEAKDFYVNEAALTGETFPVEKQPAQVSPQAGLAERTNCVFMGTNVRSGNARALIVQTGTATAYGQIAQHLTLRPPETEFERGIRRLGYLLTEVMLVLVLLIFAFNVFLHKAVLDSLLFSIALAVGLTPQLLPAIININLSKGSQAMAGRGVIVRRLTSIENLGSMDVLCTDKTGTLTEGVVRLDGALDLEGQPSPQVLRYAYLNSYFQTGLSNPLDEAIVDAVRKSSLEAGPYKKVDEVPYDFVRKRLSVVVQESGKGTPVVPLLITKGALDNVLAVCTKARTSETEVALDEEMRAEIQQRYMGWSEQGFRVLGVATRTMPVQAGYNRGDEQDLALSGFLLFFDPPKEGVQETVADLASLGVRLKVITGDNRLVALHMAGAIGLEVTGVLTGADLDELHDEALLPVVQRANLFAEVDPNQKERLIRALQKTGHVVGYMGDGINDAPALHSADVGISVDSAVDVAKEAADIVLLQKDLAVLHQGIAEGRKTFANTLKYVFLATSANFGNMFSMAGASLLLPFLPMLPKQILLINFLTDLPEMTIAGDNVDVVMVEQPRRWDITFIRRFMLVFGPLSSVFDYLTFGILWLLPALQGLPLDQETFHTGWFIESVLSALLVVYSLRTRLPFLRSRPSRTMAAVTGVIALAVLLIPLSPIARLLGFTVLPLPYLGALVVIAGAYLASAEFAKRLFYRFAESKTRGT